MRTGVLCARTANIITPKNIAPVPIEVPTISGTGTRWKLGTLGELNSTSAADDQRHHAGGGQGAVGGRFDIQDKQHKRSDQEDDPKPVDRQHAQAVGRQRQAHHADEPATHPPGLESSIRIACTPWSAAGRRGRVGQDA